MLLKNEFYIIGEIISTTSISNFFSLIFFFFSLAQSSPWL